MTIKHLLDIIKQARKERDIAIQQLNELGYEFGEKIEPTTKNNLGVEEVTALAEWIEKLTKASEDAYNKGYADGMKAQEPRKGHWIDDEFGSKCSCCGIHTHLDKFDRPMKFKYCSMCGAKMVEPQESEVEE